MRLKFKFNKRLKAIDNKLGPKAMLRAQNGLGEQVTKDMFPYVPKAKTKMLSKGAWNPSSKSVVYSTPYAKKQFYAPRGWHYTTPGTGPRWDKVAKSKHGNSWSKRVVKGLDI